MSTDGYCLVFKGRLCHSVAAVAVKSLATVLQLTSCRRQFMISRGSESAHVGERSHQFTYKRRYKSIQGLICEQTDLKTIFHFTGRQRRFNSSSMCIRGHHRTCPWPKYARPTTGTLLTWMLFFLRGVFDLVIWNHLGRPDCVIQNCRWYIAESRATSSMNSSPPRQNGRNNGRRHLHQVYFIEWKWWNSDSNVNEMCFQESIWQYFSIGSGNGLAPNGRQAVTWTNDDQTAHIGPPHTAYLVYTLMILLRHAHNFLNQPFTGKVVMKSKWNIKQLDNNRI